jgi:hypothetical protein
MNYSHIHIVLNHFPTIGTFFGLGLLLYGMWRKNQDLQIMSFVTFMVMAMLVIPTFVTGAAANEAIKARADFDSMMVDAHRSAAIQASAFLFLTGTFAWLALWQYRRFKVQSSWTVWTTMVLAAITMALMMEAGTHGGEISHPEIRATAAADAQAAPEEGGAMALFLQSWAMDTTWAWPVCETLHFTGMTLLMGVVFLVNFRLLGILPQIPFSAIHRLLPLGILGFGATMISGMLMFNGNFPRYVVVPTFFLKMFFVVVGGISVLYVTFFDDTWRLGKGEPVAARHKVFAVTTTLCWLGALYFGRMIPFLE